MKIYYLGHSGFAVELTQTILVFDYYIGEMPAFDPEKTIYVFASHFHQDHFNMDIYPMFRGYPHVTYVLSRDIRRQYNRGFFLSHGVLPEEYDERTIFLSSRKELAVPVSDGIHIWTYKSTDCGVAWLVQAEGEYFYHAGDLNWWDWDRYTPEEREHWKQAYLKEIDRVAQDLQTAVVSAAFVVLDGHMESAESIRSFDAFARRVEALHYFPMHYWDHPERVRELLAAECSASYRERIVDTTAVTETPEVADTTAMAETPADA